MFKRNIFIRHNLDATVAPTVTDDSSKGYKKGSTWVDSITNKTYTCVDNTVGNAIWAAPENISNADLTWVGPTTQDLSGNTLTFSGGLINKKGSDTSGSTTSFKLTDSLGADLWDWRNNGDVYVGQNTSFQGGANGFIFNRTSGLDTLVIQSNSVDFATFRSSLTGISSSVINLGSLSGTDGLKIETDRVRYFTSVGSAGVIHDIHADRFALFGQGFSTPANSYFSIGSFTRIGTEEISLQGTTLLSDEFYQKALTSAIVDGDLQNNYFGFHIDPSTSTLKGRYKDNLGTVTDLKFDTDIPSGLISVNDSSGVPTYYTDLQTAINATADVDTVYIHSDIELTSATKVTIPVRSNLTIALNGHRIWGDTTSGDFNLFLGSISNTDRVLQITGGGIIETIGTASNPTNAATIYLLNVSGNFKCYFNDTQIKSENAYAMNSNSISLMDGGKFYSENSSLFLNSTSLVIQNTFIDVYARPALGKKIINSVLKTRFEGFIFDQSTTVTNCNITGSVTQTGNIGLAYIYQGTHFYNNYLEQTDTSVSSRDALYVRGSTGVDGRIENNICINRGYGAGAQFTYGNGYNNWCYSENGIGINVGNNCFKFVGNTGITNATNKSAIVCLGTLIQNNTAYNLNASNTASALYVGRTSATTSEIVGNKSYTANASAYNMTLTSTGTLYFSNNIMGLVGLGLDLNGNTNAMTNTPDAYGNLKIG